MNLRKKKTHKYLTLNIFVTKFCTNCKLANAPSEKYSDLRFQQKNLPERMHKNFAADHGIIKFK